MVSKGQSHRKALQGSLSHQLARLLGDASPCPEHPSNITRQTVMQLMPLTRQRELVNTVGPKVVAGPGIWGSSLNPEPLLHDWGELPSTLKLAAAEFGSTVRSHRKGWDMDSVVKGTRSWF